MQRKEGERCLLVRFSSSSSSSSLHPFYSTCSRSNLWTGGSNDVAVAGDEQSAFGDLPDCIGRAGGPATPFPHPSSLVYICMYMYTYRTTCRPHTSRGAARPCHANEKSAVECARARVRTPSDAMRKCKRRRKRAFNRTYVTTGICSNDSFKALGATFSGVDEWPTCHLFEMNYRRMCRINN